MNPMQTQENRPHRMVPCLESNPQPSRFEAAVLTANCGGRGGRGALQTQFSSCKSKTLTFLLCDEVLDNDIRHAVSVGIAILVEAVNRAENKLVAGDGPILAAQHLDKR